MSELSQGVLVQLTGILAASGDAGGAAERTEYCSVKTRCVQGRGKGVNESLDFGSVAHPHHTHSCFHSQQPDPISLSNSSGMTWPVRVSGGVIGYRIIVTVMH